ncbi:hypothetical protein K5549_022093, partial [Capra hircus]
GGGRRRGGCEQDAPVKTVESGPLRAGWRGPSSAVHLLILSIHPSICL